MCDFSCINTQQCLQQNITLCIECIFNNVTELCVTECPTGTFLNQTIFCGQCHGSCNGPDGGGCSGPEQNQCFRNRDKRIVFFSLLGVFLFLILLWLLIPAYKAYRRAKMINTYSSQTLAIRPSKGKKSAIDAHMFDDYNAEDDEDYEHSTRHSAFQQHGRRRDTLSRNQNTPTEQKQKTPNGYVNIAADIEPLPSVSPKSIPNIQPIGHIVANRLRDPQPIKHPSDGLDELDEVPSKMSINTTYGDLGEIFDDGSESKGDFHHVRASPETRRKQVARDAQLMKMLKREKRLSSISRTSRMSGDESESAMSSRRSSVRKKSAQKKALDGVGDWGMLGHPGSTGALCPKNPAVSGSIPSIYSIEGAFAKATSAAAANNPQMASSRRTFHSISTNDSDSDDYFADQSQRTVRSSDVKETPYRLSVQGLEFPFQPPHQHPPVHLPSSSSSPSSEVRSPLTSSYSLSPSTSSHPLSSTSSPLSSPSSLSEFIPPKLNANEQYSMDSLMLDRQQGQQQQEQQQQQQGQQQQQQGQKQEQQLGQQQENDNQQQPPSDRPPSILWV